MENKDLHFMQAALAEARAAGERNEVPIGAVIVHAGTGLKTPACTVGPGDSILVDGSPLPGAERSTSCVRRSCG